MCWSFRSKRFHREILYFQWNQNNHRLYLEGGTKSLLLWLILTYINFDKGCLQGNRVHDKEHRSLFNLLSWITQEERLAYKGKDNVESEEGPLSLMKKICGSNRLSVLIGYNQAWHILCDFTWQTWQCKICFQYSVTRVLHHFFSSTVWHLWKSDTSLVLKTQLHTTDEIKKIHP